MEYNRRILLKRNTISSIVFELLTIICGFILPRFILESFGSETNGLVSSITHFLGFISLCELGIGAVVPASLYKPLSKKDFNTVNKVVSSAQRFYRTIAILLIVYIFILCIIYPLLVSNSFDHFFTISLILIISVSTFAQYFFGITYSLLLKADQRQYISLNINSVTLLLNTSLSILLILDGFSIHVVKLASSLVYICRPIALTIYVKRHYAIDHKTKYDVEPIKQKWNGIAQHFATTIQEKADTVILTSLATLTDVSIYGVYFMVINGIKGLIYSLTAGVSAMIGNMIAKDEVEELKKLFNNFEWLMHSISVLLYTITGILIVPFVEVYTLGLTDEELYIQPIFAVVLSAALAARCIQFPYNVVVQAAGHFKQTQSSAIIEPTMNIIISVILVYYYGLIGVAIGTLASMTYRVIYLAHYLMKNIIEIKYSLFIKQLSVDLLSSAIMVIATLWISLKQRTYISWTTMAIQVSFICLIMTIIINFIFYKKQTTLLLMHILRRIRL